MTSLQKDAINKTVNECNNNVQDFITDNSIMT
jgi:hypothetical protein